MTHIASIRCSSKMHELSHVSIKKVFTVVELFVFSCFVFKFLMDMHRRRISTVVCGLIMRRLLGIVSFSEKECSTKGEINLAS